MTAYRANSIDALVLIVEDDPDITRILRQYAEREGWRTVIAKDGEAGLVQFRKVDPDIVLLDINMPRRDGFSVLETLRKASSTPVIVISARIEDEDKLNGLGLGADDYVIKPFNPKEVMARVKAVLHRAQGGIRQQVLRSGQIILNLDTGVVAVERNTDSARLDLTPSEHRILATLLRTPNKVFSRSEILETCFPDSEALERTVDSHVSHLRKKLEQAGAKGLLPVVRGFGYRLGT